MGIDFDESGKNEEYEADANESTGEPGDLGGKRTAAPVVVPAAPQMHGNVNDLLRGIMGQPPASQPQTVAQALEVSQDSYMDDVDQRLEVASYYRTMLVNPLFDNDTKAARQVQFEISGFIREQLGRLLSIGEPSKKVELFTDLQLEVLRSLGELTLNHVTALKMIAGKVLGETPPPPEVPVLRATPAPAAPVMRQALAPQRRAPAPAPAPLQTLPQAAPTEAQAPRGPGRPPGSKNKPKDLTQMVQAVRRHPDGSTEELWNKDGSPRMVPVKRIQRPAGALAFPNEAQMAQVTAIQAGDHAAKLEQNPNVQKALKGLQNPV